MTYPVRSVDEDHDSLLGQRQRWMEDGSESETKGLANGERPVFQLGWEKGSVQGKLSTIQHANDGHKFCGDR